MLHGAGEGSYRQGIQDVVSGEPGAAGLQNAVADFIEMRSVVRVGVDNYLHSALFGLAQMNLI